MNIIKKITFFLFSCTLFLSMQVSAHGNGGAIAGGIIGGAVVGSAIAASAADNSYPAYDPYYGGAYVAPVVYEEGPYYGGYYEDGYDRGERYRGTRDGRREYRGTRDGQRRSSSRR